jgi:hypothetical protein
MTVLAPKQEELCEQSSWDFSDLGAIFIKVLWLGLLPIRDRAATAPVRDSTMPGAGRNAMMRLRCRRPC